MEPKQAYKILTYEIPSSKADIEDDVKQAFQAYMEWVDDYGHAEAAARLLDVIKTDPEYAYWYARCEIQDRWKEAEEYIKTDPEYAYKYAEYVIEGRWKEAEEYIKTDPYFAYRYAEEIIKGRFPEAEEYIKTDPQSAYYYAKYVIKGRFPEAEEYIKKDIFYACVYVTDVIKERWIGAEDALIKKKKGVGGLVIKYCYAINQPISDLEPFLTFKQKVKYCHRFGIKLQEELHNEMLAKAIVDDDKTAKKYIEKIAVIDKLNELSKEEIIEKIIRNKLQKKIFN